MYLTDGLLPLKIRPLRCDSIHDTYFLFIRHSSSHLVSYTQHHYAPSSIPSQTHCTPRHIPPGPGCLHVSVVSTTDSTEMPKRFLPEDTQLATCLQANFSSPILIQVVVRSYLGDLRAVPKNALDHEVSPLALSRSQWVHTWQERPLVRGRRQSYSPAYEPTTTRGSDIPSFLISSVALWIERSLLFACSQSPLTYPFNNPALLT